MVKKIERPFGAKLKRLQRAFFFRPVKYALQRPRLCPLIGLAVIYEARFNCISENNEAIQVCVLFAHEASPDFDALGCPERG